jgi:hypothetical protein
VPKAVTFWRRRHLILDFSQKTAASAHHLPFPFLQATIANSQQQGREFFLLFLLYTHFLFIISMAKKYK